METTVNYISFAFLLCNGSSFGQLPLLLVHIILKDFHSKVPTLLTERMKMRSKIGQPNSLLGIQVLSVKSNKDLNKKDKQPNKILQYFTKYFKILRHFTKEDVY